MQLADTGKRVIAYIIDAIVIGVVAAVALFILDTIGFPDWLKGLLALMFFYGYFTYLEGTTGQTLGKRAMSIRVVELDGQPISMGASLIRNLLRIVDSIFFGLVGLVLIIFTQKKQRLGDFAAQTVVVNA